LTPEALGAVELCDDSRSTELERLGRHGDLGVVSEQSDDAVEIAPLERVDESIYDLCAANC
jgi:hypothetical protein